MESGCLGSSLRHRGSFNSSRMIGVSRPSYVVTSCTRGRRSASRQRGRRVRDVDVDSHAKEPGRFRCGQLTRHGWIVVALWIRSSQSSRRVPHRRLCQLRQSAIYPVGTCARSGHYVFVVVDISPLTSTSTQITLVRPKLLDAVRQRRAPPVTTPTASQPTAGFGRAMHRVPSLYRTYRGRATPSHRLHRPAHANALAPEQPVSISDASAASHARWHCGSSCLCVGPVHGTERVRGPRQTAVDNHRARRRRGPPTRRKPLLQMSRRQRPGRGRRLGAPRWSSPGRRPTRPGGSYGCPTTSAEHFTAAEGGLRSGRMSAGALYHVTGRRKRPMALVPTDVCCQFVDRHGPPWRCARLTPTPVG